MEELLNLPEMFSREDAELENSGGKLACLVKITEVVKMSEIGEGYVNCGLGQRLLTGNQDGGSHF